MSRRRPDAGGKVALPVTPMLDMTFQLLFFFIMNSNPADLEGQMEAALPAREGVAGRQGGGGGLPQNLPPELPSGLAVEVRTRPAGGGGISALFVRGADGKSVPIDGLDALREYPAERRAASPHAEAIRVHADARLSIEQLMKVVDTCKAAGFASPALVSPE